MYNNVYTYFKYSEDIMQDTSKSNVVFDNVLISHIDSEQNVTSDDMIDRVWNEREFRVNLNTNSTSDSSSNSNEDAVEVHSYVDFNKRKDAEQQAELWSRKYGIDIERNIHKKYKK